MLPDDLDQPRWERDRAPTGGTLGEWLEAGLSAHLDDGADHSEPSLIEIDCIRAESRCLSPPESRTACRGDERTVSIGNDGEQDGYQFLASDDPLVGVVPRRVGNRMSSQGLKASKRLNTADRSTAAAGW